MCPPPPLLQKVIAPRMCQPVHGLVGMVIHPGHQLIQCCAADALTRRRGSDSWVNPLTLGRRGRHSYGSQGARGRADARTMLLRPASNRRIPLCSPALLHPAGPARRCRTPGCNQAHRTSGVSLRGHSHLKKSSSTSRNQRGTQGGTHTGAEGASRRPETGPGPMGRPAVSLTGGPPPGHST